MGNLEEHRFLGRQNRCWPAEIVGIVGAGIGAAIGAFFQALPWEVAAAIFLLLFLVWLSGGKL